MKGWIAVFLALTMALALASGCSYHRDKNGEPGSSLDANLASRVAGGAVGFEIIKSQVFQPLCIRCHNAGNPPRASLETYADTIKVLGEIDRLVPATMPQGGTISPGQLSLLKNWIRQGAPETPGQPPRPAGPSSGPIIVAPEEFRWSSFRAVVLEKSCLDCHSGDDASGHLDLSALDTVRSVSDKIVERIVRGPDDKGVMPPKKKDRLTAEQMRILIQFFKYGMQE